MSILTTAKAGEEPASFFGSESKQADSSALGPGMTYAIPKRSGKRTEEKSPTQSADERELRNLAVDIHPSLYAAPVVRDLHG